VKANERANFFSPLPEKFGIGITLAVEVILFSQLSPYFFTAENILNVSLQLSITAIIAAGMTFVILTSGINLSVGAVAAFIGVISASIAKLSLPIFVSLPLAVAVGLMVGAVSGAFAGLIYELDVIAAVVVGGTIIGTLLGAVLIGVLRNGLNLLDVNSYVQQVVAGFVIFITVMMDQLRKK